MTQFQLDVLMEECLAHFWVLNYVMNKIFFRVSILQLQQLNFLLNASWSIKYYVLGKKICCSYNDGRFFYKYQEAQNLDTTCSVTVKFSLPWFDAP